MRSTTAIAALACLYLLAGVAAPAAGQSATAPGGVTVHYSALSTLELRPEIARAYSITRSGARALLNVAVQQRQADGTSHAITATVEAAATNLAGQRQDLRLREVRDGEAIYYLAEPRIAARDTLDFALSVLPEGAAAPITVRFRQEFFPPLPR
jgi:hypothetical protein